MSTQKSSSEFLKKLTELPDLAKTEIIKKLPYNDFYKIFIKGDNDKRSKTLHSDVRGYLEVAVKDTTSTMFNSILDMIRDIASDDNANKLKKLISHFDFVNETVLITIVIELINNVNTDITYHLIELLAIIVDKKPELFASKYRADNVRLLHTTHFTFGPKYDTVTINSSIFGLLLYYLSLERKNFIKNITTKVINPLLAKINTSEFYVSRKSSKKQYYGKISWGKVAVGAVPKDIIIDDTFLPQ